MPALRWAGRRIAESEIAGSDVPASEIGGSGMARGGSAEHAARLAIVAVIAAAAVGCLPANSRGSSSPAPGSPAASAPAASPIASGPRGTPVFIRPTPTPAPTFVVYAVKAGDNLNSIARQFGTTARSIAYWNAATYPSLNPESAKYQPGLLKVGWTLQIIPNVTFDEQTLPEPSDLVDDTPSESANDASLEPTAS